MKLTILIVCLVLGILIAFPRELSPANPPEEDPFIRKASLEERLFDLDEYLDSLPKPAPQKAPPVTYGDYLPLLSQYDWDVNTAYAVMMAESEGVPSAVNDNPHTKDYSVGLFQINLYGSLAYDRPSEEWLKIPENNVAHAYKMWKSSGWQPWSVYKNGSYLRYMQ